jgi:hypothetical protein
MDWSMELIRDDTISALGSILGVDYGSATETNKDIWMVDNADRVLIGGDVANYNVDHSAAVVALVANDVVTAASLSLMKRMAKTASPKIRPLKPRQGARTSDSYVYFANSLQIRDLVADTAFLQANREARQRGKLNPLFAGADYIWDNIAIYEVEDILVYAEGAGGIDIAPSYLCGAQAIAHAWAKRPQSVEEEFDYKDKQGVAIRQWYAVEKMRFGSGAGDTDDQKDHGVVTQWCSAIAD